MAEILDTVLLLALPASGKSEVRRYLAHLSPEQCRDDFHMGPTVQLDDFPYVHMMRRIDEELQSMGEDRLFFEASDRSFRDSRDWSTLIELINEDHDDLVEKRVQQPRSAARLLFLRIDAAADRADMPPRLDELGERLLEALADKLEAEAQELLEAKHKNYPESLKGKTLVIEFARGGPAGASMPLPAPLGYRHALAHLDEVILSRAVILYVWVTPEESRRKNEVRANPDEPGSILHHGVPEHVMHHDYGCDDMDWLEQHSEKKGAVTVEAYRKKFFLPIARFDNRQDKTSFVRNDSAKWSKEDVDALHAGLKEALDKLA